MKKILFFLLSLYTFVFSDLVDLYRFQGIEAVKEQLDKELTKKEYWDRYLEDKNVDYGYYESKKYVLLAQKGAKELALYKVQDNNYELLLKENVIVGEIQGDKQIEGDLKTPTGVYELTQKLTKLDQFYGPLALVTNYPNTFDRSLNKKGHGIWIHGMPLNEDREEYTRGCIALDNPRLLELDGQIDIKDSFLIISEGEIQKSSKNEISDILSFIFKWRDSWKRSDIDEYLTYYSDSFRRFDGMEIEKFSKYKKRIFAKKEKKKILFTNINIAPYPNSLNKQMYKVIMDQDYKTKYYKFVGTKELFLELKNGEIKILAEG